jgi:EAL and modified HD-GYP domain-containing signal transduction protein
VELFVARQPILDAHQNLVAYELLSRSGPDTEFTSNDPDKASARVIANSLLALELPTVVGDKRAFINLTRDVLVKDLFTILPPEQAVAEILETVEPDAEVVAACRRLKDAGYTIALDDFVPSPAMDPLVQLADIIKVDVLACDAEAQRAIMREYGSLGIEMLAEKVETQEGFEQARQLGYQYFQGYFFARPSLVESRGVPELQFTYFRLLSEVFQPEPEFPKINEIIRGDVSLSYKLLRYINSPFFGIRRVVSSTREALSLLGDREVRRWASLLALASAGGDKPAALVQEAATRARFCETLAGPAGKKGEADSLFLVGLLSLMDAFLDRPLADVLAELSLPDCVRDSLVSDGGPLRPVLDCALSYMEGDWDAVARLAPAAGVTPEEIPPLYRDALSWTRQALDPDYAGDSDRDDRAA